MTARSTMVTTLRRELKARDLFAEKGAVVYLYDRLCPAAPAKVTPLPVQPQLPEELWDWRPLSDTPQAGTA